MMPQVRPVCTVHRDLSRCETRVRDEARRRTTADRQNSLSSDRSTEAALMWTRCASTDLQRSLYIGPVAIQHPSRCVDPAILAIRPQYLSSTGALDALCHAIRADCSTTNRPCACNGADPLSNRKEYTRAPAGRAADFDRSSMRSCFICTDVVAQKVRQIRTKRAIQQVKEGQ